MPDKFDILLLHNSINHLNERACIHLPDGEEYRNTYLKMFQQLYELAQIEAKLIACDCSCNNFFAKLGVKNPFSYYKLNGTNIRSLRLGLHFYKRWGFMNQEFVGHLTLDFTRWVKFLHKTRWPLIFSTVIFV